jgi:hypothetical protein
MADPSKVDQNEHLASQTDETEDDCIIPDMTANAPRHRDYVDITAMIRSLQRTEGFADCFRTGLSDCDQIECAWRRYCLKTPGNLPPNR